MNRFFRGAASVLVWWLYSGAVWQARSQQYPFLPVSGSPKSVHNLFQDSRGRIWIAGLEPSCFDGTRFFFLRDYGLAPAQVYEFAEDSSGVIWIAGENGVYRFAGGRVEAVGAGVAVSLAPATPDVVVAAMGELGRGYPANAALVRFTKIGNTWKRETVMNLGSPGPLTVDSRRMLLYPLQGKGWDEIRLADVLRWRRGAKLTVISHPSRYFALNGPITVMRDHAGCIWWSNFGTQYDCGAGTQAVELPESTQSVMHEAADGTMVIHGFNVLAVGRPGSFRIATRANGLPGLEDAIQAKDGTIWLSTSNGLQRMASPFRVEYWTIREGLSGVPWSIARSGNKMFAGLDKGIVALAPDRLRWETAGPLERQGFVSSLLGSADGSLIASLSGGGAIQLDNRGKVLARTAKGHPRSGMRLARTPDGQIWLGDGVFGRLTRRGSVLAWEEAPLQSHPPANALSIKYEDHTRKLWGCYNGGLVVRNERGAWKEFTTRDGLLINGCWSVAPLPNGDVWYAYYNMHAMALIRPLANGGVSVRQYGPRDGVPEPGGDTMDADHQGRLWRGGDLGVYVASAVQAEAGQWMQLDQSDGFPANGMNSGSVFVDDDGSLWWGSDNDLAHYTPPADLVTPEQTPQVFQSAFSWDGQAPRLAEAAGALPHGVKVTAHMGSLQFDRRNALRLRYRLLPEQTAWRETRSLDVPLGKLSWGGHTLEVQGRIFSGPWSATASRLFAVERPLWLTGPLLLAYFLVAVSLAGGGYLLRRRRMEEDAELLPNLASWRMGALLPEIHELEGTLLDDRFEVGALLARGGFANVLDGFDRQQQQRCAIKVFRGEVKDADWVHRRFDQEVAALQKVRHSNVVSIYAHGAAPSGAAYLVMEFVEGRNLREVLETGPLAAARTGRLLRQLASALDAIHKLGICHRDVKPENVIVRHEGSPAEEAVLIDFSIAIVKDANETLYGLSRAAGSFDYMAPEQAVGYADPASDIYSLAKVVFEMLTGKRLQELLPDAALDLPERVRELAGNLDARFTPASVEMLAMALQFDPARRPRAANSFAAPLIADLDAHRPRQP